MKKTLIAITIITGILIGLTSNIMLNQNTINNEDDFNNSVIEINSNDGINMGGIEDDYVGPPQEETQLELDEFLPINDPAI